MVILLLPLYEQVFVKGISRHFIKIFPSRVMCPSRGCFPDISFASLAASR